MSSTLIHPETTVMKVSDASRARTLCQGFNISDEELKTCLFAPWLMSHIPNGHRVTNEELALFCRHHNIAYCSKSDKCSTLRSYFVGWDRGYREHLQKNGLTFTCNNAGCKGKPNAAHRRCPVGNNSYVMDPEVHRQLFGNISEEAYTRFCKIVEDERAKGPLCNGDQLRDQQDKRKRRRTESQEATVQDSSDTSDSGSTTESDHEDDSAYNTASPLKRPRVDAQELPQTDLSDFLAQPMGNLFPTSMPITSTPALPAPFDPFVSLDLQSILSTPPGAGPGSSFDNLFGLPESFSNPHDSYDPCDLDSMVASAGSASALDTVFTDVSEHDTTDSGSMADDTVSFQITSETGTTEPAVSQEVPAWASEAFSGIFMQGQSTSESGAPEAQLKGVDWQTFMDQLTQVAPSVEPSPETEQK